MGEGLSASLDWPASSAPKAIVEPLSAVQDSPWYKEVVDKYAEQREGVKAQVKKAAWELNADVSTNSLSDRFRMKQSKKVSEILATNEKTQDLDEKTKVATDKGNEIVSNTDASVDKIEDRKKLTEEVKKFADKCSITEAHSCSSDSAKFNKATAVAIEAAVGGILLGKASSFLDTQADLQHAELSSKTKGELTKRGYELEKSEPLEKGMEIKKTLENNKEIQTVVSWAVRKNHYTSARAELSTLYFDKAEKTETGDTKQLDDKAFETVVNTLMELPETKALIKQADKTDPKIWPLLEQYKNSPMHGEGIGYALALELLWPEKMAATLRSGKTEDAMKMYQQEHQDSYRNKNDIYQSDFSTSNLTRNYVREFTEQSDQPVSWWALETAVLSDDRLTDEQKRNLVSNFYDGIYDSEGWSPAEYIANFISQKDYSKSDVSQIIASQKSALATEDSIDVTLLEIPQLRDTLPAEFLEKSGSILEDVAGQLAIWDDSLAEVFTEEVLEETFEQLSADSQNEVVAALVKVDPSYAQTFANIQEHRIQNGEEPLPIPVEVSEIVALAQWGDVMQTVSSDMDLMDFEAGATLTLPDGEPAEVFQDATGKKYLDVQGMLMSPELARDVEGRDRMIKESEVTGLNFCSPEEQLKVFDTINDLIGRGGVGVPSTKLDMTDGISLIGGERNTYLLIRKFLIQAKGGVVAEIDAMFQNPGNQEQALTHKDEMIRETLLGYRGQEGVFQRDALMDKLRKFFADESTKNAEES